MTREEGTPNTKMKKPNNNKNTHNIIKKVYIAKYAWYY